jgi:uncharacterized damage-inducible protein DinB
MERQPPTSIAANFLDFASRRMALSESEILRCCDRLSNGQFWHRAGDYENSIANLLLHLQGNMRQWILHGIDNQPDIRRRDDEFTLMPTAEPAEILAGFRATLHQSARVIAELSPDRLLTIIDPQPSGTWRHATILEAIFKVVGHLEMHTGQIILLTKQLLQADLDLSMPRKR